MKFHKIEIPNITINNSTIFYNKIHGFEINNSKRSVIVFYNNVKRPKKLLATFHKISVISVIILKVA